MTDSTGNTVFGLSDDGGESRSAGAAGQPEDGQSDADPAQHTPGPGYRQVTFGAYEDTVPSAATDLVSDAFVRVRTASKRKNGRVPSLKYQAGYGARSSGFAAGGMDGTGSAEVIGALLPGFVTGGHPAEPDPEVVADKERSRRPRSWPAFARPSGPDGRPWRPTDRPEKLVSILGREIASRGWRKGLATGFLTSRWEEIVGPKISQHTTIEMVKGTTLFLSTDSTAWATNLRMMQRNILSAIAEQIGPDVVTELRIYPPKAPSWRKGRLHVKGRGPRDTYG